MQRITRNRSCCPRYRSGTTRREKPLDYWDGTLQHYSAAFTKSQYLLLTPLAAEGLVSGPAARPTAGLE